MASGRVETRRASTAPAVIKSLPTARSSSCRCSRKRRKASPEECKLPFSVPAGACLPVSERRYLVSGSGVIRALRPTGDGILVTEDAAKAASLMGNKDRNDKAFESFHRSSAPRAASCSASFLFLPNPLPHSSPSIKTDTLYTRS